MNNKGLAIGCLVCGIVAIATSAAYVGIAAGIVAIVLASKSKAVNGPNNMTTAGLVTGIIGLVLSVPCTICNIACNSGLASLLEL